MAYLYLAFYYCFFFSGPDTNGFYTLSLHDALPICATKKRLPPTVAEKTKHHILDTIAAMVSGARLDRKSTRLNSSHVEISYAVFCLKKKNYEWLHGQAMTYL